MKQKLFKNKKINQIRIIKNNKIRLIKFKKKMNNLIKLQRIIDKD